MHLVALDSQKISGFSELTLNINGIRWIWMSDAFHIHGRKLLSYGRTFHIHGKALKTSQELRMLSSVTINCQVTMIVMNPGSQLSVL